MQRFVRLFPFWLVIASGLALVHPPLFTWFLERGLVPPALALIMLAMGMTLRVDDFARVARNPRTVLYALVLQYGVMPSMGVFCAWAFGLPHAFAAGLILVCCCPGGTASNVITYLARANVPLSVSMTALSTLVAPVATPLLATWLIGDRVAIDPWGLVRDALVVVLVPVGVGVGLRSLFGRVTARLTVLAAPMATVLIVLIVSAILGANREPLVRAGWPLIAGVFTAHALGFFFGFVGGRVTRSELIARTFAIEVGMQNSGLGVVLARGNFADPLVAVPSALSSVFHSLIGSGLAAIWSRRPPAS